MGLIILGIILGSSLSVRQPDVGTATRVLTRILSQMPVEGLIMMRLAFDIGETRAHLFSTLAFRALWVDFLAFGSLSRRYPA